VIKDYYRKRKIIGDLFLELNLELNLGIDLGQEIAISVLSYKFIKNKKNRVILELYDTVNHIFAVRSSNCRFYREYTEGEDEGLVVPNVRELWGFLRHYEYDAKLRLADMYTVYKDKMSQECRQIVEEILNTI